MRGQGETGEVRERQERKRTIRMKERECRAIEVLTVGLNYTSCIVNRVTLSVVG